MAQANGDPVRVIGDHVRMVRLDERGAPIRLDEAARRRLCTALDRERVVAAYLFGSQAKGTAGPLSDVDVAVWVEPELERRARFDLQLELLQAACAALGTDEVQLVVLNDATPLLGHRVLGNATTLVDRDPRARIALEARAILDYLDTKPLRAELARGLKHRLEEGRFGRR